VNKQTATPIVLVLATVLAALVACQSATNGAQGGSDASADATSADVASGETGDAGVSADAGPFLTPGPDASVVAFDSTLVCFGSGGTGPCSRTVDQQVAFPSTGAFSKIDMHVTLKCPSNGCDPWDRAGSIDLVEAATTDGGPETLVELGRFMTPYGITSGVNAPPSWDIDVTELRPLLVGTVTLRVFIDTWVPQGNAAAYGGGWVVGTTFEMTGGVAAKAPVVVLPLWTWNTTNKEPTEVPYGDPNTPIATSVPPRSIELPAGPTSWGVRSTITGHGQANLDNCSEFCSRDHWWTVGTMMNKSTVWRTDCSSYPSQGTYQYPRAGWCPGASVIPWDLDVTSQVSAGSSTTFTYGVDAYLNTCNASANDDGGLCTGCSSGESCAYDGSDHTAPFFYVSSLLIGFE
jgi:Peptide-N-glycosidase F, C terminal/Peptide-N-glycosidase F, N terminal